MSDLLIKGMEMPKEGEWISVNIFHDGKCFVQSWCGMDFNFAAKLTAVPVPPHDDLIDYDFCMQNYELLHDDDGNPVYAVRMREINSAPTIIPSSKEE